MVDWAIFSESAYLFTFDHVGSLLYTLEQEVSSQSVLVLCDMLLHNSAVLYVRILPLKSNMAYKHNAADWAC